MDIKTQLKERRSALKSEAESLINRAELGKRGLTSAETRTVDGNLASIRDIDERIAQIDEDDTRTSLANASRITTGGSGHYSPARTSSRDVYAPDRADVSFFGDLVNSRQGDFSAIQRLSANNDAVRETRAGDMASSGAATGGTFAPPAWLVSDFAALARPHRVTADLLHQETLPRGISSINIPAVSGGASSAVQATQNSALSDVAMTSTSVSSGITLIGGKQIVSRQLIDQSGVPFDRVILGDLAAAYASALDVQVLTGSNASGQLQGLDGIAGNTVTYTTAAPSVVSTTNANSLYYQLITGLNKIHSGRYLPPTAVVMHPRRWAWVLAALDTANRPLITPSADSFNAIGMSTGAPKAEGQVGEVLGVPVYVDPNVSITANSSTNQDEIFILRADDSWLYESAVESTTWEATYADNFSVLYRVAGYSSLVHRYAKSITKIVGTGLVDPGLG